ncbi:hypothetical protein [Jiangella endophytica]|uniref:hypothetical protein n=1 Tax=Jiangella endophytica TaxID=1623398 RepID=UPI000E3543FA|nr:hypothetical protein [Jiangella endophytica]
MTTTVRRPRWALLSLAAVAVLTGGCGSAAEDPATTSEEPAATSEESAAEFGGGPERGGPDGALPGAFGVVAANDGTTLQVQGTSGQVAVTWTDATAITSTVAGSVADLVAGACVLVQSEGGAPEIAEVTATSVAVTQPAEDGSCDAFGGGFGGGFPGGGGGRPTAPPDGAPTDRPSRAPGGEGDLAFGGRTSGVVTEVSGDMFTVEVTIPGRGTETAEPSPGLVTVTTSAATTWTTEAVAGPEALVEGSCVFASGEADTTGAVTAASIAVSPAVDGACQGPGGVPGA